MKRVQAAGVAAGPGSDRARAVAVRIVGGASVAAAGVLLLAILWPLRWNLVAFWLAIEVIFWLFFWRPRYAELTAQPTPHRPASEEGWAAFERVLRYFEDTQGIDYEMYYSGWFLGAPFERIRKGNAEEFLAYAFWYRTMQEMRDDGMGDVPTAMLRRLEEAWGLELQAGYTPGLQFMGHLWEPLKAHWRPLAFYLGTWAIGLAAAHMLRRWGFQQASHQGMSYFTLNMESRGSLSTASAAKPASQPFGLPAISGSTNMSDKSAASTATSPATPPTSAEAAAAPASGRCCPSPPAAMDKPSSAPDLPAYAAPKQAAAPEARSISAVDLPALRTKSSPFVASGLNWATRMASDAEHLSASINVASAVHSPPQALPAAASRTEQAGSAIRRSGSSLKRRMGGVSFATSAPGTPRLTSHTSMALRTLPNPLEQVLSEELANPDMPVLFLHGVGGLPAYLEMLLQVMALNHPLIVTQCTAVAMRLGPVLSADEVVEQVVGVLDKLGVEQACVIGHSYGTFVAGRLARLHRHRVRSLCLIDPVCFGMFMPQLLYNFLYTKPQWKGLHHIVDFVKKGGVYLASHELHVCTTFSRCFYWADLNLWPEDLAPGSVVLLSGRDDLMNAQQVKTMLERPGHIKVHYNRDLSHGEFLIKREVKQAIMEEMRTMLTRSGSAVVGLARPVLATTMTLACNALGVGGVVRLQTAGGGAKYVEDHTNKLVRTFTGNLTAMLQQVQSFRPAFESSSFSQHPSNSSSSSGGTARSRLSPAGASAAAASASPASSAGGSGASSGEAADKAPASYLAGTMSVPIRRRSAKSQWSHRAEDIMEQTMSGLESSGSNDTHQDGQQQQQEDGQQQQQQEDGQQPLAEQQGKGEAALASKKDSLAVRAAARRSSGSGRVDATACGTPVNGHVHDE